MKKLFAAVLALVLMLTAVSALAEVRTYMMVGVQDAEGNVVVSDELPVLVLAVDDEAMTVALGTEDNMVEGTLELVEMMDEAGQFAATLADGSTVTMVYTIENDCFAIVDEESGLVMVLMNIETLADAA